MILDEVYIPPHIKEDRFKLRIKESSIDLGFLNENSEDLKKLDFVLSKIKEEITKVALYNLKKIESIKVSESGHTLLLNVKYIYNQKAPKSLPIVVDKGEDESGKSKGMALGSCFFITITYDEKNNDGVGTTIMLATNSGTVKQEIKNPKQTKEISILSKDEINLVIDIDKLLQFTHSSRKQYKGIAEDLPYVVKGEYSLRQPLIFKNLSVKLPVRDKSGKILTNDGKAVFKDVVVSKTIVRGIKTSKEDEGKYFNVSFTIDSAVYKNGEILVNKDVLTDDKVQLVNMKKQNQEFATGIAVGPKTLAESIKQKLSENNIFCEVNDKTVTISEVYKTAYFVKGLNEQKLLEMLEKLTGKRIVLK